MNALITEPNTPKPLAVFAAPTPATPAPNPQTPQEIADALMATFEEFRAKNDERLAQLEQSGEDAVTRAEVENLNTEITRLNDALTETMRSVGRITVGGNQTGSDRDQLEANARRFFQALGQRLRAGETVDAETYSAYRGAFGELIRAGLNEKMLAQDIRAALSVGSDRDGGYFVPPETSNEIERRIFETSPMRQVARIITIGRDAWEAPYKAFKGVSGGWVGEQQARPATGTGDVGMQRIEVHEQYAYPEITQQMLDDPVIDAEDFLMEDTEDEMVRTENTAFVSGNGMLKPRGFLHYAAAAVTTKDDQRDWGKLQFVHSGAVGGFPKVSGSSADDADALIDIIAELNPAYRAGAAWAMARRTEAEVRKLKDADGRYIVGFGDIRDGALGFTLHGFPIVNMEDMPDIGVDSFSIAFGNWRRGYLIVDRMGFRVLMDPYTNKPYVGFYITKRTGGDVRNFDAIKLMKFAAPA